MKINLDNIKTALTCLTVKEWMKWAGYAAACLLGLALFFSFVVRPQSKILGEMKSEDAAMKNKSQSYRYFDEFTHKLEQQREKVTAVIDQSDVDRSVTEKNEQNLLDAIGRICKEAGIKFDTINPVENEQAWIIVFSADYRRAAGFLQLLEKSFKIESYDMKSGEINLEHKVEMTLVPIRLSAADNKDASPSDFIDLYDKTNEIINTIETKQATRKKEYVEIRKDPMYYGDTIMSLARPAQQASRPAAADTGPQAPDITIDGIYWDPVTPVVVIGGRAMREGDTFKGVTVEKILEKSISVNWRSRSFTLRASK
ncbi:MAG: hypothetical protein ACYC5N_02145 [Endomicrobiales bacterium]